MLLRWKKLLSMRYWGRARCLSTLKLTDGLRNHVSKVLQRYASLVEKANSAQCVVSDDEQRKLFQAVAELQPVAALARRLQDKQAELGELEEMAQSGDHQVQEMVREEEVRIRRELVDTEASPVAVRALVPQDEADKHSAILEVRAGAGGDEASLFAAEIFQMYQSFSTYQNWNFEVLSVDQNDRGGYKHANASVSGEGVFGKMKYESGVHRVQRIPATEGKDRVHTSTVSVAILPQPPEVSVDLLPGDIKVETFRAGGAGGQHVNTTDSAVRMTHLPTGISVSMQDERSQHKNRSKALKILRARIYEQQHRAMLEERRHQRHSQIGSAERHEKIRTYNFPQDRITDHRLGHSVHGMLEFLRGGQLLEEMVAELRTDEEARALTELYLDDS